MIRNLMDWNLVRQLFTRAADDVARRAAEYCLGRYRAYAPVDTGFMAGSARVVKVGERRYRVVVGAGYSQWVEFGHLTPTGTWVPPNPALRKAMADTVAAFPSIARSVRLARPTAAGNESEGAVGTGGDQLGVTFDN